jgi:outer membrane protein insertion porin family
MFLPAIAFAQEQTGPIIEAIDFEGLGRVEPPAVKLVLTSKQGKPFEAKNISEDIRAIYAMGYFNDVQAFKETTESGGVRLIFVVTEKPAVRGIEIRGHDEISEDDIKEVIDIRAFTILNEAKIKKNVEKVKDLYNEKGFYLAEIDAKIEPAAKNEVTIVFDIVENAKVEVRSIRFVGNRNLESDYLKSGLQTQEGNLISFLTGAGTYRKDAFQVDLLRISSAYFDHGYINVKVDTPDIEISPDRKFIYITIRIEEGEQYYVGNIDFSGDLVDSKEKLQELSDLEQGEVFNRSTLGNDPWS